MISDPASTNVLSIDRLRKAFGGLIVARDLTMNFEAGSITALIGPNGAGKTTLFNLISGVLKPDSGRVVLNGSDLVGLKVPDIVLRGIARAFQIASLFPTFSVKDAVCAAVQARSGEYRRAWGAATSRAARERADELIDMAGLGPVSDRISSTLSHGDQKLLDIALALAAEPRVLLLDEPTAGMGPEERWRMIERVHALWQKSGMTVVFIEHDMDIVFKIAQRVYVLCYGSILAEGTPTEVRNSPAVIEAYLGQADIGAVN